MQIKEFPANILKPKQKQSQKRVQIIRNIGVLQQERLQPNKMYDFSTLPA